MADTADLEEVLARLQQLSGAEAFAQAEAARRAAAKASRPEPTIIPMPEFGPRLPHPAAGLIRYPCGLGCGWAHVEDAFEEEPLVMVLRPGSGWIDEAAFNELLATQAEDRRERIESAIRDHFTAAHPGWDIPTWRV